MTPDPQYFVSASFPDSHLVQTRFNWDTERARLTDIVAKVAAC